MVSEIAMFLWSGILYNCDEVNRVVDNTHMPLLVDKRHVLQLKII